MTTNDPTTRWGELLALLLHDFRTPLASIMLNLEMLQQDADRLSPEQREDIEYAFQSAVELKQMMEVSHDLAHLVSGGRSGELRTENLTSLLKASMPGTGEEGHAEIWVEAPKLVTVRCNPELTRRVLHLLLKAARDVTPPGDRVNARISGSGDRARVEIADGGRSIPGEWREKVFDVDGMLELRKANNSLARGMGPVLCSLGMESQGGAAGLDSDPDMPEGKGNVFWIELPLAE
ncbi:MAG: HAMP domain-containing sensor histidine kinase [Longimicrobiales bacterium]|nr:HAMP domain-containing sensor histidine kinase [Longimicrobiales bacterium]